MYYQNMNTPEFDSDTGNAIVNGGQVDTSNTDNWFELGGQLLENSGQLASIFSPKYRADQIAMAQNRGFFDSSVPTFGGGNAQLANQRRKENQNLIIIIAVAVVVILVMIFLLKSKK
ncbi:MAG TPA: hypothetical protein VFD80_02350 [Flavobacteriaceae bacterium]|nr:hypothetical protein [Flavobacteriaceae bacterium]